MLWLTKLKKRLPFSRKRAVNKALRAQAGKYMPYILFCLAF